VQLGNGRENRTHKASPAINSTRYASIERISVHALYLFLFSKKKQKTNAMDASMNSGEPVIGAGENLTLHEVLQQMISHLAENMF